MTDDATADAPARGGAVATAAAVTVATTAVMTYVFNPDHAGDRRILLALGGLYAFVTAFAVARLARRGELAPALRPAIGDISLGALTAGILYGGAKIAQLLLAAPGTPRQAWIIRIYLQIGEAASPNPLAGAQEPSPIVSIAVGFVAALEEMVWRGLVQRSLGDAIGDKRALFTTSALFAIAHLSTVVLLRDPQAGYNPLVVAAGFGCSIVWGALAVRTRRLLPSLIAHALFSWAVVEFPLWRP